MDSGKITVEESGLVLMIGLNRTEEMNALDPDMHRDLGVADGELQQNPEIRDGSASEP